MGFSKYPGTIDSSTELPVSTDLVTPVKAEIVNRQRDAIIAIETELGPKPSGTYTTVKDRLDAIQSGGEASQNLATTLSFGNSAGGSRIINLADPINPQDAATKAYADAHGGGGGGDGYVPVQETIPVLSNGQTAFTLSQIPGDTTAVELFVEGTKQQSGIDYTVAGTSLTYLGVPLITSDIVEAFYFKKSSGGGGSQTLAQTLVFGNLTGGKDIRISNGDSITSVGNFVVGSGGGTSIICASNFAGTGGGFNLIAGDGISSGGFSFIAGDASGAVAAGGISFIGGSSGAGGIGSSISFLSGNGLGAGAIGGAVSLTSGSGTDRDGYIILNRGINEVARWDTLDPILSNGNLRLLVGTDVIAFGKEIGSANGIVYIRQESQTTIGGSGIELDIIAQSAGEGGDGGGLVMFSGSGGNGGLSIANGGSGANIGINAASGGDGFGAGGVGGGGGSVTIQALNGGNSLTFGGDGGGVFIRAGLGGTGTPNGNNGDIVLTAGLLNILTISGISHDVKIDGYTKINNDLAVTGKLYLDGLIDPAGMVFTKQASAPTSPIVGKTTLWSRISDEKLIHTDGYGKDRDVINDWTVVYYDPVALGASVNLADLVPDSANRHKVLVKVLTGTDSCSLVLTPVSGWPADGDEILIKDIEGNAKNKNITIDATPAATIEGQQTRKIGDKSTGGPTSFGYNGTTNYGSVHMIYSFDDDMWATVGLYYGWESAM